MIEATDTVQAQNDFIAAITALNKARSALDLAQIHDKRAKDLFEGKAVPLKEYQQSQADLVQAQNDMRSAETALEAARNRLRILGRSDEAITAFQEKRQHQSGYAHLLRRSPARSCSARSARANMSAPAPAIRCS